jgi:SAM-dependent methyltransferase
MNTKPNYSIKSKKAFGAIVILLFLILLALFLISLARWAVAITIILGLLALNALLGIVLGPTMPRAKRKSCRLIAQALKDKAGGTILDIGAGTGIVTIHLAKAGFQATGVDIKEDALTRARENAKIEGVKAAFRVNDGSSLEWPDGSFEAVTSVNLLHETEDPKVVLAESYRVLKPGGILVMADFRRGPAVLAIFWAGIFKFLSRKTILRLLQEARFEGIQISKATLFHHLVVGRKKP